MRLNTRKAALEGIKIDQMYTMKIDYCNVYRLSGMLYLFNWRKWIFDIRDVYKVLDIENSTEQELLSMIPSVRYENQLLPIIQKLNEEKYFIIVLFEAIEYGKGNRTIDRKAAHEYLNNLLCHK